MLKTFEFFLVYSILHVIYLRYSNTHPDFGPFNMYVSKVVMCKGPKRNECCNTTMKIEKGKKMQFILVVKNNFIPNRGKVTISVNGQRLARLHIKRPCDNVFLRPIMQKLLNVTQKCEFQKGIYKQNMDLEQLAQEYYGGKFFYGNLNFQYVLFNDSCNIFCINLDAVLSPKSSR